jgi:hypothetical protein
MLMMKKSSPDDEAGSALKCLSSVGVNGQPGTALCLNNELKKYSK